MRLFIVCLCLLLSTPLLANIEQQRQHFISAEKAFKKGDKATYKKLKAKLKQYPLYQYLEYNELKNSLSSLNNKQVRAFMDKYPGSPLRELREQH